MTPLLGPADADHFRVKVGRYGDRWYTDPLTGCTIAPPSEWQGPSVSATKPPFANKYVPMRAIADMPSDEWQRLATKDADDRYEAIKTHDKLTSRTNMDRGSIVHLWAEDLLFGRSVERKMIKGSQAAIEQAERFLPALESFFDTHQPELVACEVVCLHRTLNGVGYGGTSDAYIKIEGDIWCVDWKSRNSDHDAYADEAGQGGAYIGAEYMIIRGPDGNPMRAPLPKVAGVLIVSIREDGFRAYPIDADGAILHYEAMHAWWCAQQDLTHSKVIGRPWAPKVAAPTSQVEQPSTGEPVPSPVDKNGVVPERPNGDAAREGLERAANATTAPPGVQIPPTPLEAAAPVAPDGEQPSTGEAYHSPVDEPGVDPSADAYEGRAKAPEGAIDEWEAIEADRRRATLRSRYDLLNDEQKADYTTRKQAIDTNDLDAVERLLDEVEPFSNGYCRFCDAGGHTCPGCGGDIPHGQYVCGVAPCVSAGDPDPYEPTTSPDEGPDADDATIAALQREFERLSDEAKFWIASLTAQGRKAGVDWRPNALPTVRRYELARGIVRLAKEMA